MKKGNFPRLASGFTVIEMLVVIFIVVLLGVTILSSLSVRKNEQALSTASEIIISSLSEARTKSVASEKDSQYGVYLETNRVVIFPGVGYTGSGQSFYLDGIVSVSTTSLSQGTSTIVFKKITGETDQFGTITISLRRDASQKRIIEVKKTGSVSQK